MGRGRNGGIIVWCDEGRSEKRGRSLCGGETRRRAGGEMGGNEKRDEGQGKPVMCIEMEEEF